MRSQATRNPATATNTRNLRKLLIDVLEEASTRGITIGIGDRVRQARMEAGLTQPQLADLIGVQLRQVQNYESGDSDPYRKLRQISDATGKTVEWLLRGDQPSTESVADDEILARLEAVETLLRDVLRRLPESPAGESEEA